MGTFDFATAQELLVDLKKRGYISAIFGGGEPFFWPHDLKAILKFAHDLGLKTQVGTNSIKLPADFESWNFVDRWVIPLDGVTNITHNQLRQFQNRHWEIITQNLKKLKQAKRSTTISTVLTAKNRQEILAIGEYLRDLQDKDKTFIHAWHLYQFLPFGRGGSNHQHDLNIPDAEYENLFSQARALQLPFKVFKRKNMLMSSSVEFYWVENGQLMSQSKQGTRKIKQVPF